MGTRRQNDFDREVQYDIAHRPWPMPHSPWVMRQTWHDLLFAHWPMHTHVLRAKVPRQFPLDLYDDRAWIGIIPFHMTNVAPRGVPALPWISAFPELNVRTYVTVNGKPGVYFFSLDAANPVAVGVARALAHLPYFTAAMEVHLRGEWIEYSSRRTGNGAQPAELKARYRPIGEAQPAPRDSLEHFLTERYCLYTVDGISHPYRLEIHHPPWSLQAAEAEFEVNTMAEAAGMHLPAAPPLLHFARRQDMIGWPLKSIEDELE
jgi:uncharacterized protein YqjF (DUF2071 family)